VVDLQFVKTLMEILIRVLGVGQAGATHREKKGKSHVLIGQREIRQYSCERGADVNVFTPRQVLEEFSEVTALQLLQGREKRCCFMKYLQHTNK